jgi:hypothetical protein
LDLEEFLQLRYAIRFDAPTQDENGELFPRRFLDLQGHGLSDLAHVSIVVTLFVA